MLSGRHRLHICPRLVLIPDGRPGQRDHSPGRTNVVHGQQRNPRVPVAGGPVYFAAGALWATGEPVELFSVTAAVDSRAVDAPTGGETPDDYLTLDSSNRIEGTIGVGYGPGDSAAGAKIPAPFTATYDPAEDVVIGTVSLPEMDLEFTAEGT